MKSFQKGIRLIGLLTLSAMILAGCSDSGGSGENGDKLKVTSTTGMIGDLVVNIGGEHVESESLMKPGIDPHLYKATQGDIGKLEKADVIFYNGLNLEGKMVEIFEQMEKNKPTVPVTKALEEKELLASADYPDQFDPHIWFDVKKWITAAEVVRDELIKADQANADFYRKNAESYIKEMEEIDAYAKKQLNSIPKEKRILVTAHDAFGYFGEAYDLEVVGLQGISTSSEAGSKDVTELRDFLVEKEIKAVFVESSVPKNTIEAVIEGAKEKGHTVTIGGELYSDAMGNEGTEEGTYIGMVKHNVDTVTGALK